MSKADEISIESEPPGATVYTMGQRLGETPLVIRQSQVFPAAYSSHQHHLYGFVAFQKDGCKDYSQRLDSVAIHKGIQAKLECAQEPPAKPLTSVPEKTPISVRKQQAILPAAKIPVLGTEMSSVVQSKSMTAKKRLLQIEELRRDGLISEGEYGVIRRRILDQL